METYNNFLLEDKGSSYAIVKYEGDYQEIIVPCSFNGKPITEIADNAFAHQRIFKVRKIVFEGELDDYPLWQMCHDEVDEIEFKKAKYIPPNTAQNSIIRIGSEAEEIDEQYHWAWDDKTVVLIDNENPHYCSLNNGRIIASKDGKTLLQAANFSQIPEGIEIIGDSAYEHKIIPAGFKIPPTVKKIGSKAFFDVKSQLEVERNHFLNANLSKLSKLEYRLLPNNLKMSLIIPRTVEEIGDRILSESGEIIYGLCESCSPNYGYDPHHKIKIYGVDWEYYKGLPMRIEDISSLKNCNPFQGGIKRRLEGVLDELNQPNHPTFIGGSVHTRAFSRIFIDDDWDFDNSAQQFLTLYYNESPYYGLMDVSLMAIALVCAYEGSLKLAFNYMVLGLRVAKVKDFSFLDSYKRILDCSYNVVRKGTASAYGQFFGEQSSTPNGPIFVPFFSEDRFKTVIEEAKQVVETYESIYRKIGYPYNVD